MKTKYLIPALSLFLCSCGDDITRNTYIQEYKGIDVLPYLVEPCAPRELVANENGDIFVCSTDSTWIASNTKADTVLIRENDTVVVIEKDTITINTKDTVVIGEPEDNLPKCGIKSYDTLTHFCDERDNKVYRWVKIGTQTWMAENLNYGTMTTEKDVYGRTYFYGTRPTAQKICFNDDENMCEIYGGLYNSDIATRSCPHGWHLPDSIEWKTLTDYAMENYGSLKVLRSQRIWSNEERGNDALGFSIIPAGSLTTGNSSSSWNYSGLGSSYRFCIGNPINGVASCGSGGGSGESASIRCIKDS